MIEMLALAFFIKKTRTLAEEKNINPKKWIWKLVLTWFGVEFMTIILIILASGKDIDEMIFVASLPAILLASLSALYTVNLLKKEPENPSEIEIIGTIVE